LIEQPITLEAGSDKVLTQVLTACHRQVRKK